MFQQKTDVVGRRQNVVGRSQKSEGKNQITGLRKHKGEYRRLKVKNAEDKMPKKNTMLSSGVPED